MSISQKSPQYKLRFIDAKDHEALKQRGREQDRSLNYLINQAIKQFLQRKESAKA